MNGERHITVSGNANYIEYIENYNVSGDAVSNQPKTREMPIELKSESAQKVLKKLAQHGLLDEKLLPQGLSSSEAAVLAYQVSNLLGITEVWRVFGNYWGSNPNSFRTAYNRGMDQKKTMDFLDEINPLLNNI